MLTNPSAKVRRIVQRSAPFLAIVLAACAGDRADTTEQNEPLQPPETVSSPLTQEQVKFETSFMTQMIDHHGMAVRSGTMCTDKAIHIELRGRCQSIVVAQNREIDQMQTWLKDWYGLSHGPSTNNAPMMDTMAAQTGEEFERHFLEMMISHHAQAVREGTQCKEEAVHTPLRGMCEEIVISQAQEIQQMGEWLKAWYGVDVQAPGQQHPHQSSSQRP